MFDGYEEVFTESPEHTRRSGNGPKCPDVKTSESNKGLFSQERFFSNEHNKSQLINLPSDCPKLDSKIVHNYVGDTNTKIVLTVLDLSYRAKPVVAVADNTGIAFMMLYHWREDMSDYIFYQSWLNRLWNIKLAVPNLGLINDHLFLFMLCLAATVFQLHLEKKISVD